MESNAVCSGGLPLAQRRWAVAGVWLALIVSVLDNSIANVALPSIARDLHASPADSIAVVSSFQLGALVSLLPFASLGEIVTYRRVFLGGLTLFTAASLGCAVSQSLSELVLFRAIQGIGAAGIMSSNGALARYIYPHRLLGAALGGNALVIGSFSALGPSIAAAILVYGPWQWLFAMNLPLGLVALLIGYRTLPRSPRAARRVDGLSMLLNVIALSLISIGIDSATSEKPLRWSASLVVPGALVMVALIRRSSIQSHPLVPVDLLRFSLVRLSALTSTATFLAQSQTLVWLPFYFEETLHFSSVRTGLLMTPWPLGIALAAPVAGRLADRLSVSVLSGCGLLAMTTGLIGLLWLPSPAGDAAIALNMLVCGVGFGFFQAPNNRTLMSSAPMERAGAAAGLIALSRMAGQISGALLAAIFLKSFAQLTKGPLAVSVLFAATASMLSFARKSAR